MSRVQQLATAARSPVAKFHELRLKYWNADLDVVCCFEGADDIEFYLPHVRQQLGLRQERVGFVNCSGKGIVLNLWRQCLGIKWNLARIGFFVDRDLDDFISGNPTGRQLYVTDEYSIESNAVGDGFFNSVWQEVFRLSFDDARYLPWINAFREGREGLASILFPIFYIAVAVKRAGGGVDFDKLDMSDFYSVDSSGKVCGVIPRPSVDYSKVFLSRVSLSELRKARADLISAGDFRLWLRGKAALAFAILFLSRMKVVLGARGVPNRCKVRVHFNDDFAVSCLCARTQRPSTLSTFLDAWASLISADGLQPVG